MKRVIVLTTPTSATASLWRILDTFAPSDWPHILFIDQCLAQGMNLNQVPQLPLPERGLILFNQPHLFNFDQDFSDTHIVLNFRDPRDLSCNQYYWQFAHPKPELSDAALQAWRDKVREDGLDRYALGLDHNAFFQSHVRIAGMPELRERMTVTSYIQLCFDTSGVVERIARLFGREDDPRIEEIKQREHPSNLVSTNRWIGGKWEGADVFPGRARVEMQGATFTALTDRYRRVLDTLADLDDPRYRFFYS